MTKEFHSYFPNIDFDVGIVFCCFDWLWHALVILVISCFYAFPNFLSYLLILQVHVYILFKFQSFACVKDCWFYDCVLKPKFFCRCSGLAQVLFWFLETILSWNSFKALRFHEFSALLYHFTTSFFILVF